MLNVILATISFIAIMGILNAKYEYVTYYGPGPLTPQDLVGHVAPDGTVYFTEDDFKDGIRVKKPYHGELDPHKAAQLLGYIFIVRAGFLLIVPFLVMASSRALIGSLIALVLASFGRGASLLEDLDFVIVAISLFIGVGLSLFRNRTVV